ncbi:fungal-specific transcription factor domain-containing protein [Ganoderma leucocontextum]|nr:fungal-specific transcription factor domain-containing protein [Ganoderma leucocontextum]
MRAKLTKDIRRRGLLGSMALKDYKAEEGEGETGARQERTGVTGPTFNKRQYRRRHDGAISLPSATVTLSPLPLSMPFTPEETKDYTQFHLLVGLISSVPSRCTRRMWRCARSPPRSLLQETIVRPWSNHPLDSEPAVGDAAGDIQPLSIKIAQVPVPVPPRLADGGGPACAYFGKVRALPKAEEVEYPERDLADKLVDAYFARFHFLMPVLDKSDFMRRYRYLMDNPTDAHFIRSHAPFVALVCSVFAVASRFVEDPRLTTPDNLDEGGMGMVYHERAASMQVEYVQCFVLISFLCSVNCQQAWLLVGQAVRAAQDIGLHHSQRRLLISTMENEIRRKIWWGGYTLDGMLALALGRPLAIEDTTSDSFSFIFRRWHFSPVDELQEHMRIELLDPKWKSQHGVLEACKARAPGRCQCRIITQEPCVDADEEKRKKEEEEERLRRREREKDFRDGHTASKANTVDRQECHRSWYRSHRHSRPSQLVAAGTSIASLEASLGGIHHATSRSRLATRMPLHNSVQTSATYQMTQYLKLNLKISLDELDALQRELAAVDITSLPVLQMLVQRLVNLQQTALLPTPSPTPTPRGRIASLPQIKHSKASLTGGKTSEEFKRGIMSSTSCRPSAVAVQRSPLEAWEEDIHGTFEDEVEGAGAGEDGMGEDGAGAGEEDEVEGAGAGEEDEVEGAGAGEEDEVEGAGAGEDGMGEDGAGAGEEDEVEGAGAGEEDEVEGAGTGEDGMGEDGAGAGEEDEVEGAGAGEEDEVEGAAGAGEDGTGEDDAGAGEGDVEVIQVVLPPRPKRKCNRGGQAPSKRARVAHSFMPRHEEDEELEEEDIEARTGSGADGSGSVASEHPAVSDRPNTDGTGWVISDRPAISDHPDKAFLVGKVIDFIGALNLVQLAMKVDSLLRAWHITYKEEVAEARAKAKAERRGKGKGKGVEETIMRPSVTGLYYRHLQNIPGVIQDRTFRAWVAKGYRFAALASAGWKGTFGEREDCLSCAEKAKRHILEDYGLPRDVHCGDLKVTDRVFGMLANLDFKPLDRDWDTWKSDFPSKEELATLPPPTSYFQLQQSLLGAPLSQALTTPFSSGASSLSIEEEGLASASSTLDAYTREELSRRVTISTNYNPTAKTNLSVPYPKPGPGRNKWTLTQRQHAKNAHQPSTVEALCEHLGTVFYTDFGIKKNKNAYVRVDPALLADKDVLFQAQDKSIVCLILGDMPSDLREPLERNIEMCLGGSSDHPVLQDIRTPQDMAEFITIHFQHYARMCQKGGEAPQHIHPWFLRRAEVSRTNHRQMVAYESREMLDNYEEYDALCLALEQVFTWIERKLKVHLGDLYDEIACYAEELPGRVTSPAHPFAGFVLNLNIAAKVHRDVKDNKACLVLPIGLLSYSIRIEKGYSG